MKKPTVQLCCDKRKGTWVLRRWSPTGKKYQRTIGKLKEMTKKEAEYERRQEQALVDTDEVPLEKPKEMTFAEYAKYDSEVIAANVAPRTLLEHDRAVAHAMAAIGGNVKIGNLTRAHVGRIKQRLKATPYRGTRCRSADTVRKVTRTLSTIVGRAKKEGLIRDNPFAGESGGRSQSKTARFYTPAEIGAMVEVTPSQWWRVAIQLALKSGLRQGELLNLLWSDVDFTERLLTVSRKDAGTFEAKGEDYPILEWSTKTHEERTVPLDDETLAVLQRFRLTSGGSQYVFLTLERLVQIRSRMEAGTWGPTKPLLNNFLREFKRIQRHARKLMAERAAVELDKVEWRVGSFHDTRKTYGNFMKRHVSPDVLQRLMGHADLATTMKYYTGTTDEDTALARAALSSVQYADQYVSSTSGPAVRVMEGA